MLAVTMICIHFWLSRMIIHITCCFVFLYHVYFCVVFYFVLVAFISFPFSHTKQIEAYESTQKYKEGKIILVEDKVDTCNIADDPLDLPHFIEQLNIQNTYLSCQHKTDEIDESEDSTHDSSTSTTLSSSPSASMSIPSSTDVSNNSSTTTSPLLHISNVDSPISRSSNSTATVTNSTILLLSPLLLSSHARQVQTEH